MSLDLYIQSFLERYNTIQRPPLDILDVQTLRNMEGQALSQTFIQGTFVGENRKIKKRLWKDR
jgi:hypothetical protein